MTPLRQAATTLHHEATLLLKLCRHYRRGATRLRAGPWSTLRAEQAADYDRNASEYFAVAMECRAQARAVREADRVLQSCGHHSTNPDTCGMCGHHIPECDDDFVYLDDTVPIARPQCPGSEARLLCL